MEKVEVTMVRVTPETRDLLKKLARKVDQTIPEFLKWGVEQLADALDVEKPEAYKSEQVVDRQLETGDFETLNRHVPKKQKTDFFIPDTRKQWDKHFGHRANEFSDWWDSTHPNNPWMGPDMYYATAHMG